MKSIERLPYIDIYNIYGCSKHCRLKIKIRLNIQIRLYLEIGYFNGITQEIPICQDSKGRYRFDFGVNGLAKKVFFDGRKFDCKRSLMKKGYMYKKQKLSKQQRIIKEYFNLLFGCKTDKQRNRFIYLLSTNLNVISKPDKTIHIQHDSDGTELARFSTFEYDYIGQTLLSYISQFPKTTPLKRNPNTEKVTQSNQLKFAFVG